MYHLLMTLGKFFILWTNNSPPPPSPSSTYMPYKLLPESQHGFRAKRSTMTALSEIHRYWVENTERGDTAGVFLGDLSTAFDTLNTKLLCDNFKTVWPEMFILMLDLNVLFRSIQCSSLKCNKMWLF